MAILIKRYANRKLYNTESSRYITLKGIAELLEGGEEVRVIDNETGEDITNVALSQILVDNQRTNTSPPDTLLSQIFSRGGDVLYGALRKGMDDASDGLGEIQDRVRRIVRPEPGSDSADSTSDASETPSGTDSATGGSSQAGSGTTDQRRILDWLNLASPDLDHLIQSAVERVFKLLDLPRRADVEALNRNLERVASAVETLERVYADRSATDPKPDPKPD